MSSLAIRRVTRRLRRHAAGVLIVLTLGAIIGVHHSALASGEMHHGGMGAVVELCLGVFSAVGAAAAAVAIALRSIGRWSSPLGLLPIGVPTIRRRLTLEPRAGPSPQALLCIWRH
jgi:hypothetical protein